MLDAPSASPVIAIPVTGAAGVARCAVSVEGQVAGCDDRGRAVPPVSAAGNEIE